MRLLPVKVAMRKMIEYGGNKLNSHIVKMLTSIVPVFPVGARIRVSNAPTPPLIGYYGVVAKDNPEDLERPKIIIYESKKRQKIKPILVDLQGHDGFELELVT